MGKLIIEWDDKIIRDIKLTKQLCLNLAATTMNVRLLVGTVKTYFEKDGKH